jgi:hypothetical protein
MCHSETDTNDQFLFCQLTAEGTDRGTNLCVTAFVPFTGIKLILEGKANVHWSEQQDSGHNKRTETTVDYTSQVQLLSIPLSACHVCYL